MAIDKAVDSEALNAGLTSIANAIRSKNGATEKLTFPNGFVSAVNAITLQDTASIDMSNWANNSFTETYVNGDSATRSVTKDANGRPVTIENPDGGSVSIEW